jgi:hypothetical protein
VGIQVLEELEPRDIVTINTFYENENGYLSLAE